MLQLLHIENIAVIERADIELENGLTVLSGETGAGKSIVIDSIGAILGKRVSRDLVRAGAQKGFVSAVWGYLPVGCLRMRSRSASLSMKALPIKRSCKSLLPRMR